MFSFFGLPPLAPNRPLPRAIFDGICVVFCTSSTLQKRAAFLTRGGSAARGMSPCSKSQGNPACHAAQYARRQMPCASPDLKQAGACGRRPGQVSQGGGKQPKKNTSEASKGNQNQPYLIQLGEGLPTVFPPSFFRFCCPVFLLPPVGFGYPQTPPKTDHRT